MSDGKFDYVIIRQEEGIIHIGVWKNGPYWIGSLPYGPLFGKLAQEYVDEMLPFNRKCFSDAEWKLLMLWAADVDERDEQKKTARKRTARGRAK